MAQVPTYNSPQVEQRALPGVRQSSVASPSIFNGAAEQNMQIGKGLSTAGAGLGNAAYKLQERENADMLFRAETALKDSYLKFEQDIRSRRGENAKGVTADAEKWFAEQGQLHSQALENDQQRYYFNVSLTKLRQSSMGSIAEYEDQQGRMAVENSARGSIVGTINQAASDAAGGLIVPGGQNAGASKVEVDENGNAVASVPGVTVGNSRIDGYKRDIRSRVDVLAQLNGWPKEKRDAEEAMHLTNLHKQVIQVLADKNPTEARRYLDENKGEINGSDLDSIERVVKLGGLRSEAQAWVDKLAPEQEERFALEAARIEFADRPETRDAVIAEVRDRFAEKRRLREQGQADAADSAWKIAQQGGGMKAVPSSLVAAMDGKTVLAMQDYFAKQAAGVGIRTDPSTYYDLRTLAAQDPASFRRLDLKQYLNALSPSDFQEMVKLQTNDTDRTDAATLTQQLSNTHDLMKWGSSDKAKKGAFDKAVTDAINVEQNRLGKKLDYTQRQAIIDKMLIQGEVDGSGFWSDKMQYFEATPEQRKDFAPKISSDDRKMLIDRFKALKGYAPSEQEINDTYKKWKGL